MKDNMKEFLYYDSVEFTSGLKVDIYEFNSGYEFKTDDSHYVIQFIPAGNHKGYPDMKFDDHYHVHNFYEFDGMLTFDSSDDLASIKDAVDYINSRI